MTTTSDITTAAATLGRKGGKSTTEAKAAAARENGSKGGRPKGAALKERASEVGLIIDGPIHDGTYWVSGLEHYRSESWIRKEIYRRATETSESDE